MLQHLDGRSIWGFPIEFRVDAFSNQFGNNADALVPAVVFSELAILWNRQPPLFAVAEQRSKLRKELLHVDVVLMADASQGHGPEACVARLIDEKPVFVDASREDGSPRIFGNVLTVGPPEFVTIARQEAL